GRRDRRAPPPSRDRSGHRRRYDLLCRHRTRLHPRRDLAARATVRRPRTPHARSRRRAVRPAPLEWDRQPRGRSLAHGWLARAAAAVIPRLVLLAFGVPAPVAIRSLWGLSTSWRIAIAVAVLVPVGFAMGMVFPRGLEMVRSRAPAATPWLWAVNGVASVLGS